MPVPTPVEYVISTDTADGVVDTGILNSSILSIEWSGSAPDYLHIEVSPDQDTIHVLFENNDDLPDADKALLDAVIANHAGSLTSEDRLDDYKTEHEILIDNTVGQLFWDVLTLPRVSLQAQSYILLAHLFKGMEAQDFINDRDSLIPPPRPNAYRRNGMNKKRKILEDEADRRGISESDLADLINPWSDFQQDFIAGLEKIRAPAKDDVRNAVDHVEVDTVYAQFQVDLGTYVASLTPPG